MKPNNTPGAMKREIYRLTLYAVQVFGVHLTDQYEPHAVEIICNSEEERNTIRERAKKCNLYDELNSYYISEEAARRSINWALFILNIIHPNNEKH